MVDTALTTVESGEPMPTCSWTIRKTVWYAFTPETSGSYTAYISLADVQSLAVYTGPSLEDLTQLGCFYGYTGYQPGFVTLTMDAGVTYFFQTFIIYEYSGPVLKFELDFTPPPIVVIDFWPGDPNILEDVAFYNYSTDPVNIWFQSSEWDLGDGAASSEWAPIHRYAADGDYTVGLTMTTYDGRVASTDVNVQVRTPRCNHHSFFRPSIG